MGESPTDPPKILDYRRRGDALPPPKSIAGRPIAGFFLGLALFGFPNTCISLAAIWQEGRTAAHVLLAIYAAVVVAALFGFPLYAPRGRRDRILSGMFLGFGVAAMLNGLCIVSSL